MNRKTKLVVRYGGHTVKKNQSVSSNLDFRYDQLPKVIELMMGLNLEVDMAVQFEDKTELDKVGGVRLHKIWINGDGAGTIQIGTDTSFVDMDVFNQMAEHGDEDIVAYFKYELED